jgi:hypothetical protein
MLPGIDLAKPKICENRVRGIFGSNFFGRFHGTEIGWKSVLVGKPTILVKPCAYIYKTSFLYGALWANLQNLKSTRHKPRLFPPPASPLAHIFN